MAKRTALVTGGMGGIGTAVVRKLAASGHTVVANCLPGFPPRDEWLSGMRAEGFLTVHAAEGDVTSFKSMKSMVEAIASDIGPIDILINTAGVTRDSTFRKLAPEDWAAVVDSNLNSIFNVTKQVVDGMVDRGWGRIISLSSVNGVRGQFGQTNYAAAKAGILGFSKSLAQEVVRKGVTVNCVSPGYVETSMVRAIRKDVLEKIVEGIPIGRLARPDEIAALVGFLASEDAAYITGTNVAINGGLHMY